MKTLIIGGVAGGASAAARLRRLSENSEIIIFERGEYVSFANCGLPYYIGNTIIDENMLTLQTPQSFKSRFNIDVRTENEVIGIDTNKKEVSVKRLRNGEIYKESYDNLILSPGAMPFIPKINGIDSDKVFTLRNIPDTFKIKNYIEGTNAKSAIVIGGGYIGIEMADNLKNDGLSVSVIEMSNQIIGTLDYDMAAEAEKYISEKGINLVLNKKVMSLETTDNKISAILENGKLTADMVILAIGVKPDTEFLKSSGINQNARGSIIVDKHMRTNKENVYAVGDSVEIENFISKEPGMIALAGPANKQGRIAADNITGIESVYNGTEGAAILKVFDMAIASVGLNEKTAAFYKINYDKTYTYSPSNASYYPGATNMSVKILWDKDTLKLIGAQIVGFKGVDKRMDVLSTAIRFGADVRELAQLELCYAPPFSSAKDPVNMAGFVAENVIGGLLKQFFWDDVKALPKDGSVTLLDVRTKTEVTRGNIDGFINIPLDMLRESLDKIPKGKPVYVHCHSGLRSYIACRILSGNGYDCYNLAGGYRFYETVVNKKTVKEYICTECK